MKRRLQIGVFGSHLMDLEPEIIKATETIGRKIAELGHILITGASTGVSHFAAKGAKESGGLTVGIVPGTFQEIDNSYINTDYIDVIISSGFGFKGRNVLAVRSCNTAVFINGGIGTLNELLIAIDEIEGKCFILKDSGGIADIAIDLKRIDINIKNKIERCSLEFLIKEISSL